METARTIIARVMLPVCILWVGYSAVQWTHAANCAKDWEAESTRVRASIARRRAELAQLEGNAKDVAPWKQYELQVKKDAINTDEIQLREYDQNFTKDSADVRLWRSVLVSMSAAVLGLWLLRFCIGFRNAPSVRSPQTSSAPDRSP